VSDAGSGSRIPPSLRYGAAFPALRARRGSKSEGGLRLRRTILLLFEEKILKTGCFESLIVKHALEQTRSVCLRDF